VVIKTEMKSHTDRQTDRHVCPCIQPLYNGLFTFQSFFEVLYEVHVFLRCVYKVSLRCHFICTFEEETLL